MRFFYIVTSDINMNDGEKLSVFEGYMFMQGSSRLRPWNWKARYLILTNECLYCFKRRGDLTSIPLNVIHLHDVAVSVDELRRGFRRRYCLRVTSPRQRKTFNLFCFLIEERNEWFSKILQVLARKYTDREPRNSRIISRGVKSRSVGESSRHSVLEALEHSSPMSISCLELTNLGVINDPTKEFQTVTPISKTFKPAIDGLIQETRIPDDTVDVSILDEEVFRNNRANKIKNTELKQRSKSLSDVTIQEDTHVGSRITKLISRQTKQLSSEIDSNIRKGYHVLAR